jgi:tetratricopeptide (TPR) repeat protein
MKYLAYIFITSILFISCKQETKTELDTEQTVLNKQDYNKYLVSTNTNTYDFAVKNKEKWAANVAKDSNGIASLSYLASAYNMLFNTTGNVNYLDTVAQLQERALKVSSETFRADKMRARAATYISQHKFQEAKDSLLAIQNLSGKFGTNLMLFDAYMETGEYNKAETILDSLKNNKDYDYLIRAAKWNDHKGDLDTAINLLEKAREIADKRKNPTLQIWIYSNLGDFYGHAGRIEDSYNSYLKTLELQPDNSYVKKGLAWIAYSYEKNPEEALRILDSINVNYNTPDYHLLRAEIAEFQDNDSQKQRELELYRESVANPAYGEMYNAYNAVVYAEEFKDYDKALQIAERDVANRPTPETYHNLAYVHHLSGNNEKALMLIEDHVKGKTYEPMALYHSAIIYKANGMNDKVETLKNDELLGTAYEMGPVTFKNIKNL